MAAYFTGGGAGTDVQAGGGADGLQTLYLMNPNYVGYADAAAPAAANMMLLNSAVSSLTPASFGHHHHQPAQHFVGIPLQPPHSGYNLWAPATTTTCVAADMTSPRQEGGAPSSRSAVSAVLSLSSREAPPVTVAAVPGTEARYMGASPTTPSQQEQVVMSSRYLKAAQELLDEAVSVGKGVEEASAAKKATVVKKKEDSEGGSGGGAAEDGGSGGKSGGAAEMSTAERQEVQTKKSKLLNMLDEVEQRYQQYHHQMQAVASSFEVAAGLGSARTYTALALRTISRQFRCLRDAITAQVRSASRALGEEGVDPEGGGRNVGSRLRFIDHQLRQQRALQQLGMAQGCSGAWRPQRGLPERSVSVLRAWLFEHFLHPYPKDSDKVMLAKQTGLTRSQVSNWFINARVRLWKPMVEEMYLEEAKGAGKEDRPVAAAGGVGDDDGISGDGGRMGNNNNNGVSMSSTSVGSMVDHVHASASGLVGAPRQPGEQHSQASLYGGGGSSGGGDRNDGALFQDRLKKARTTAATTADEPAASFHHVSDVATLQAQAQAAAAARRDEVSHRELLMKFMEASGSGESGHRQNDGNDGGYSLFTPAPYGQFGSEEQFAFAGSGGGGGGVSLTLGLPHGANAAAEQTDSFLMSGGNGSDGAVTAGYDMNMQSTKSLAAQLMRDFVA